MSFINANSLRVEDLHREYKFIDSNKEETYASHKSWLPKKQFEKDKEKTSS